MSVNRARMAATPPTVFAVLRNGFSYSDWVVGTKQIRAVDDSWPAPGSLLHHSVGLGPIRLSDDTKVLSVEPDRCLEMEARAWPAGTARVEIRLTAAGAGTDVEIEEHPLRGTAAALHNPLFDLVLWLRNVETLRRLKRIVETQQNVG
ncbi:MAG: SRPBCC family protein [Actinomycetota bacterium]|nr:SRPBCC family protein [Actinomycetota bacterium]